MIQGGSGSGKSTILKAILSFSSAELKGEIRIGGKVVMRSADFQTE